jgi:WD40 repeat protein
MDMHTQVLQSFSANDSGVTTFEFHPYETVVAVASQDRLVRIWDAELARPLYTSSPETQPVSHQATFDHTTTAFTLCSCALSRPSLKNPRIDPSFSRACVSCA